MSDSHRISIDLSPELQEMVSSVLGSGEFASASDVVRDALMAWKAQRDEEKLECERIGALWDAGIASGPPEDGEKAFFRISQRLNRQFPRKAS